MGGFRPVDERELASYDESGLIAYALAAREQGDREAEVLALQIFAFGMEHRIRGIVRVELGGRGEHVIEEVVAKALEDSIRSIEKLKGESAGEARAFVIRIARRRVIDHIRKRPVEPVPLEVDFGEGDRPRPGLSDGSVDGEAGAVELALLVGEALDDLRPDHRLVVEYNVFGGHSAARTSELVSSELDVGMTEENVHQVVSRFRKDLRDRLEDGVRTG